MMKKINKKKLLTKYGMLQMAETYLQNYIIAIGKTVQ